MKKNIARVLLILVGLVVILTALSGFFVNYQWFREVGYLNVFFTSLKAKILVFVPVFVLLFMLVNFYGRFLRNGYIKFGERVYEKSEISKQNKIISIVSLAGAFILSMGFTGIFWYRILEFINAKNFNVKAPIFNKDASFFVFKLPLIEAIIGVLVTIIIILIVIALMFYGFIKLRDGYTGIKEYIRGQDSPLARFIIRQISIFGAIFLILLSGVFYIKGLQLAYSSRGVAFGASYTDVHVTLPMYKIISITCIAASIVIAYSIIKKRVKWIMAAGAFIFILIICEGITSAAVERFIVSPNARDKELPYLKYNIESTRYAFGLDNIAEKSFEVDNALTPQDIKSNKDNIDNIRVLEFSQSLEVFNQIQTIRNYYKFNDVDIDRYVIDGKLKQVFVAARELDNTAIDPQYQTWQNMHLYYTHGYGGVMTYTNTSSSTGLPEFVMKDMPLINSKIKVDKPQIYFGEVSNDYIVAGGNNKEIDYPSGNENKESKYSGSAGIKMNPLNKLLFTVNTGNLNFLLSDDITSDSRMIMNRNIVQRVRKIAPFLGYDNDPYLVAANGRFYWIIDAYTTSDRYPFAEQYNGINYIRNSVKVVIDAYDGKVNFYLSDSSDAIAKTIGSIYGGIFKDIKDMPGELKTHLRYSEDVFTTQAKVYEKYHMVNPVVFYNSQDLWNIAKYKGSDGKEKDTEPVYQMMKLPGESEEDFLLAIPFTASGRENMVSWLAVKMDGEKPVQRMLIRFSGQKSVYGPQQFNSKINTNTSISSQLTLWGQKGSEVILGETYIMPINNSLLYIRPLYLRAEGGKSLPELKKVIVGFGDNLVMEDSIQMAFEKLFNTDVDGADGNVTTPEGPQTPQADSVSSLSIKAADLFSKAKEAQKSGDWAGYGKYLNELENVLNMLKEKSK